ncbi:TPA: hypothetical protein DEW47_00955 [Patescibacteria group bacterium]|nr:MAG: hypothetical protein UT83_C0006G0016 [Parcubacteria group bacterium GW2011_GWA2_40_143]KKR60004.1 MAG: hypothetical protein UT97_C0007G0040 [Parcubacteria group bacterium GW2011_GWC2_40_31]KKR75538.1 MAG: hypothetical protein UU18_C0003G0020 [Parcubacteria group bacterium GW2011_GWB2_40_8]KKR76595.1 MAG: hypothetical protein UU20_C0022G0008 [Parcubacteria group bacterium GW2011_GWE2_40_8]HBB56853.1 hypothetical protein [Patescibacteria group bacterium]
MIWGGGNSEKNIKKICESDNGYIIATIAGDYGGAGFKVVRYDIENNIIEIAKREDVDGGKDTPWYMKTHDNFLKNAPQQAKDMYSWFNPPADFGNVSGQTIELFGYDGDAGCHSKSYYDYNVIENYVKITKRCSKCESDAQDICTEY